MIKQRPLNSVLIKPAGPDCNLDCTYCFYLEKSKFFHQNTVHRMSPVIQEELIRQVMQHRATAFRSPGREVNLL